MGGYALGSVARIWRYPVKSLRAEALQAVRIEAGGLVGDRGQALVVHAPEHARDGKPLRGKEHNLFHTTADVPTAESLAARRGVAVALEGDGPYFDARPVSVLVDCWLHEIEALVGARLDPLRYRPNLYVAGAAPCEPEEAYVGRRLEIGDVALRVVAPIKRCVTTTYDVVTGAPDPRVLGSLARERDNVMGIYCTVERPGSVALGASVTAFDDPPAPSSA
jgi:uncharacterized protein YcbX